MRQKDCGDHPRPARWSSPQPIPMILHGTQQPPSPGAAAQSPPPPPAPALSLHLENVTHVSTEGVRKRQYKENWPWPLLESPRWLKGVSHGYFCLTVF